jgi:single-strand DNA-binding protein
MNINKAILCGRVTRQPELRTIQSGTHVTSFSLATNTSFKNKKGERVEETDFHNVTAFGKPAEIICQYVGKGDELMVMGRIKNSKYENKEGVTVYKTDIIMDEFTFGVKSQKNQGSREDEETSHARTDEDEIKLEDIPF